VTGVSRINTAEGDGATSFLLLVRRRRVRLRLDVLRRFSAWAVDGCVRACRALILASDLATSPVTPDDNPHTAPRLDAQRQIHGLPIVDPKDPRRVICVLPRGEVIAAYDRQVCSQWAWRA
jgi:hypothetical protein